MKTTSDLRVIFSQLEDPRSDINKLHKLEDILLIGVISVICGRYMEKYGDLCQGKRGFFKNFP